MSFTFDGSTVEAPDSPRFDPVPAGRYKMVCVGAEFATSKSGLGKLVKAAFEITGSPAYRGRQIFANFNLQNANPVAERIGKSQFKEFLMATGMPIKIDLELGSIPYLEGKQVEAELTVKPAQGDYGPKNEVKKFHPSGAPASYKFDHQPTAGSLDEVPF